MTGYIYIIRNLINNKIYVGQTILDSKVRWQRHCSFGTHNQSELNMVIKRALMKYGKENFEFKVIETIENCTQEILNQKEIYYIEQYKSFKEGYNSTAGGQGKYKDLKIKEDEYSTIIDLFNLGCSLRMIAEEYNVDKATIKHILEINNVKTKRTRTYKYTSEERQHMLEDAEKYGRKYVYEKYGVSHSYLSQLISGKYRI